MAVAKRPKLRKYISRDELEDLLETIDEVAEFVKVASNVTECRDPKDNYLLSLAIDGKADYLLTGDKDLLELKAMHMHNGKNHNKLIYLLLSIEVYYKLEAEKFCRK